MEFQAQEKKSKGRKRGHSPADVRRRYDTLEKFLQWKPSDGFKYEWNKGVIEKSPGISAESLFEK